MYRVRHLNPAYCFSLSFRLWIPQVRGQPHGFSFSIQLDSRHPPRWAAGPPYCAWRRRSISSSAPLSTYVCLQDLLDLVILFSPLYVPIPSCLLLLICPNPPLYHFSGHRMQRLDWWWWHVLPHVITWQIHRNSYTGYQYISALTTNSVCSCTRFTTLGHHLISRTL